MREVKILFSNNCSRHVVPSHVKMYKWNFKKQQDICTNSEYFSPEHIIAMMILTDFPKLFDYKNSFFGEYLLFDQILLGMFSLTNLMSIVDCFSCFLV